MMFDAMNETAQNPMPPPTYQQTAPEDRIRVLQGRVQSIADTHALLSRTRGTGVDLAELIRGHARLRSSDDRR